MSERVEKLVRELAEKHGFMRTKRFGGLHNMEVVPEFRAALLEARREALKEAIDAVGEYEPVGFGARAVINAAIDRVERLAGEERTK